MRFYRRGKGNKSEDFVRRNISMTHLHEQGNHKLERLTEQIRRNHQRRLKYKKNKYEHLKAKKCRNLLSTIKNDVRKIISFERQ